MWAFYSFERLVFTNVKKILLIIIWIFISLSVYMWGVERVTDRKVKVVEFDRGGEFYENKMKVDNVQVHLQNSLKAEAYVHSILCMTYHNRMVWLKGKIVL